MRVPAAVLLALLVLAPVQAQTMDFEETHQVRIAYGDIPSTNAVEPDGAWNLETTYIVPVDTQVNFTLPAGHAFTGGGCTDCTTTGIDGSASPTYTTTCTSSTAGDCAVHFTHRAGGSIAFGTSIELQADALVVLYTPGSSDVVAVADPDLELACTNDQDCTIHTYRPVDAGAFWFVVGPQELNPDATIVAPSDDGTPWWLAVVGAVVGAAVWYVLVQQGIVQKRQRRQVAAQAGHKEAAKEGKATLEGRKRVLMAALKELEVAKMNKEMDSAVYDTIKADFKKQAVTAMRALEESE